MLKEWLILRKTVSNWILLYVISGSFILDVIKILIPSLFKNKTVLIKFKNGLKLAIPLDKYADLLEFAKLNSYTENFRRFTGQDLPLEENDIVVDIGAHTGTFCIPLLNKHSKIKVFAFEPENLNYNTLLSNIKLNQISSKQINCYKQAVFGESGHLDFEIGSTSTVGSVIKSGFYKNKGKKSIQISAVSLVDFFKTENINTCKLLKMDCEGSEYSILFNTSDAIISKIQNMIIEAHPTQQYKPSDMLNFLKTKGFLVDGLDCQNGCWEYFCHREKI